MLIAGLTAVTKTHDTVALLILVPGQRNKGRRKVLKQKGQHAEIIFISRIKPVLKKRVCHSRMLSNPEAGGFATALQTVF
ncbi:MAG: hypothetical protein OEY11_14695 [Gammaproteobacteria bacterium]|nr:hypothetical protein [Gammaproteobacteria bacterium]